MYQKENKKILGEWTEIAPGIVRDSSGRQGQFSKVDINPLYDSSDEQKIYKMRKSMKAPLVRTYGSELVKNETEKVSMNLISERMPHRLSTIPQLTLSESFYVLDQSLAGYEHAYQQCGPFIVDQSMIGFTPEGETRVWVNSDFKQNHPSQRTHFLKTTCDEEARTVDNSRSVDTEEALMVQNIVNVVGNHCQNGKFPEPFCSRILNPTLSFQEARSMITKTVSDSNVYFPDHVDLIHHKVKGYRQTYILRNASKQLQEPEVGTFQQPIQPTHTTISNSGYRFHYLPVQRNYEPDVFASSVGEHGVHNGHHY